MNNHIFSGVKHILRSLAVVAVAAACLTTAAFAVDGTVTASSLKVRQETSTNAQVLGMVRTGDVLNITGKMGDWYLVDYNGHAGFVFSEYVKPESGVQIQPSLGTVTGASVNVRTAPSLDAGITTKLIQGTMVNVLAVENGWYMIKYLDVVGYVHADYLSVNGVVYVVGEVTDGQYYAEPESDLPADADVVAPGSEGVYNDPSGISSERQSLLDYAMQYLGTKYVYGGASPSGFDCSGFTYYVFKQMGYSLNRSASAQYKNGTSVSKSELIPGDLVFFSRGSISVGHVGIYIGNGNFIHSSSPGDVVKITSLDSTYYAKRYVGAKRILN